MTSIAAVGNMDVDDPPLATWIGGMLQCPTSAKESSKLVRHLNSFPVIVICSDYICFLLRTITW
jgi:hypothetical protein